MIGGFPEKESLPLFFPTHVYPSLPLIDTLTNTYLSLFFLQIEIGVGGAGLAWEEDLGHVVVIGEGAEAK